MGAVKSKRYMTPRQMREEGIVPWSKSTFDRKIKYENIPHIKDGSRGVLIDQDDFDRWMAQRKVYGQTA